MGKSTINGPFSIAMLVYQRVTHISSHMGILHSSNWGVIHPSHTLQLSVQAGDLAFSVTVFSVGCTQGRLCGRKPARGRLQEIVQVVMSSLNDGIRMLKWCLNHPQVSILMAIETIPSHGRFYSLWSHCKVWDWRRPSFLLIIGGYTLRDTWVGVVNPMHHPIGSTIWRLFFILNRGILSSVDVGPFPIGWLMKIEGFETTLW